ncbi:MAG: sodium:calcium antiporter [Actinomycetota bacterium]|nr:sodium:calcium antiporter [Actinomycetota bacterium]
MVGALIGGIGTGLPQLIVGGFASAQGHAQLAVGSAVGSITVHIGLALGIAPLVSPIRVDSRTVRREAPLSVASVVLFAVLVWEGLTTGAGVILVVALVAAIVVLVSNARNAPPTEELEVEVKAVVGPRPQHDRRKEIVRLVSSLVGMAVAADPLVRGSEGIADHLGIAGGIIGLTMVAIGTSAPVIASSIQAVRRGHDDLMMGNILGSNLFIALGNGAVVAFLSSTDGPGPLVPSLFVMVGMVLAGWAVSRRLHTVTRWEAASLLVAYVVTVPLVVH